MDPVSTVKSNITPGKILGFAIAGAAVFAILDLLSWTDWLLYPVTSFKKKFNIGG